MKLLHAFIQELGFPQGETAMEPMRDTVFGYYLMAGLYQLAHKNLKFSQYLMGRKHADSNSKG